MSKPAHKARGAAGPAQARPVARTRAGGRAEGDAQEAEVDPLAAPQGARRGRLRPARPGRGGDRAGARRAPELPQAEPSPRPRRDRAGARPQAGARAGDRGRHRARRIGDRDGGGQGARPLDEGVRRIRHDPAARRAGRRGRAPALRRDRGRRGEGRRRGHLLRLPRRPLRRGDRVVRPARRPGGREQRGADPGVVRGHDPARRAGRLRPPRRRLVRVDHDLPVPDRAAARPGRADRARRLQRVVGLPHRRRRVLRGPRGLPAAAGGEDARHPRPGVRAPMSAAVTARRLGRRYLPAPVRRAVGRLRAGGAAPPSRPDAPAPPPPDAGGSAAAPPRETLVRMLERGEPLDRAMIAQVRSLVGAKEHDTAVAIAESLRAGADTAPLGHVAAGIAAARRGYRRLAWAELRDLPRATWARYAPAEYVRSGLALQPEETLREIRALVADDPEEVRAKSWHEILVAVWGHGESDLAREIFAIFDRHVREDSPLWRNAELHRDWMRSWVAADPDSPSAPPPPGGRRTFAVMDYGHPSATKASANIGDHVQTIAALGHLVRHQGVRLHGREDLVDLLEQLRGRTRPDRRRHDVETDLEVITVHRDASIYEPIPEDTWVLCFGWLMHSLFKMRHGFPLHRNLRPIFVSFHCNKRELLTPDAIDYLRRYGPVGCRDWTTVDLLLSIGVPAFFSGCLTTTIDTVFPDLTAPPGPDAPVAYVDMPAADVPAGGVTFKHSSEAVRRRSFVANVYAALDLLETYRREHRGVVTSRLHCYLPVRSLGMDVDFRPANRSDVRFDGLIDITDAEFDRIRDRLLGDLEQVFGAILSGRPEAEVYGLWRELTAAEVAAAERRHRLEARLAPVAVEDRVLASVSRSVAHGPEPA